MVKEGKTSAVDLGIKHLKASGLSTKDIVKRLTQRLEELRTYMAAESAKTNQKLRELNPLEPAFNLNHKSIIEESAERSHNLKREEETIKKILAHFNAINRKAFVSSSSHD